MLELNLKKLFLLGLANLLLAAPLYADTVGVEIGAYQWNADYSGAMAVDDGGVIGSDLDIENDLGFNDGNNSVFWASVEHPVPFLPNFKVVISDLDQSASSTLTRNVSFGGQVFNASENTTTRLDLSNIELTLYYELLDNWINLDAGITLRQYDGVISMQTDPTGSNLNESQKLDFVLPLAYLKGRVDLPLTGLFVDGEINFIGFGGDSLSDVAFSLGYESEMGLGAKAGYRTFTLEVDESNYGTDLDFSGAYFSLFFHF